MSANESGPKGSVRQRVAAEMRDYLIISFYLWICFASLLLYKMSFVQTDQTQLVPQGVAVIKALIMGKFILIGKMAKVGTRLQPGVVLLRIAWKSFALLVLLFLFHILEEVVVGYTHGHSIAQVGAEIVAAGWLRNIAPVLLMLLIIIPLITFEEVDHQLGKGTLKALLFGRN